MIKRVKVVENFIICRRKILVVAGEADKHYFAGLYEVGNFVLGALGIVADDVDKALCRQLDSLLLGHGFAEGLTAGEALST